MCRLRFKKGFTLVELMIVVALIAVVAGGAVSIMGKGNLKAKYSRMEADCDSLHAAITQTMLAMGDSFDVPSGGGSYAVVYLPDLPAATKTVLNSFLSRPVDQLKDPIGGLYYRMRIEGTPAGGGHGVIFIYPRTTNSDYYYNPYNHNYRIVRVVYNNP
jgi:prepilin-type N-terminal cleavage/methylation domain-containing protein